MLVLKSIGNQGQNNWDVQWPPRKEGRTGKRECLSAKTTKSWIILNRMTCGILWNQLYLWWLKLNSNMKRQTLSKRNGDFKQNNCVSLKHMGVLWLFVEPPPWTVWVPISYPRWQIEDHQRSSASQGLGEFSTRCPLSVSCDISAKSSTDLRMSSPCVCFFLYSYIYIYKLCITSPSLAENWPILVADELFHVHYCPLLPHTVPSPIT